MKNTTASNKKPTTFKRIFRYFLEGLLILTPIAITIWAVITAFNFIDNIIPNLIYRISPTLFGLDASGNPKHIPGVGFVVLIILVILVGWISSNFLMGRLIGMFDHWLERTPGIKFIYSSTKDFFEAFAGAGEKKKFDKPVVAALENTDVWRIGFITQKDMSEWGMNEYVAVYVPMSYSIAGNVYILPLSKIKPITNISSSDAMKFAISGGVTTVSDDDSR